MRRCKGLFCLLILLLCCTVLPASASAKADADGSKSGSKAEGYENVTQTWTETDGNPLSGKSDFYTRDLLYDKATNKQFITIQGRGGNIFYIVIDYDAQVDNDEEKYMVYFLNQVDEGDLDALIEKEEKAPAVCSCAKKCAAGAVNTSCEICSVNMSECVGKEPEPEPEADVTEPEQPEKKNYGPLVMVLLMAVLAGAGAVCYLKFYKKKPDVTGSANLDDYDYGDEEEAEGEPWEDGEPEDSEE